LSAAGEREEPPREAGVDAPADDRFYQGRILRLHPGSRSGVVRTGSGRDIAFAVPDVQILGSTAGFAALSEGMRIGFDLGRTSRGLRVTTIRVYGDASQSGNDVR
jgi:hypothetical protein